jgi:transposase
MCVCRFGNLHALRSAFVMATSVDLALQVIAGAGFNLSLATPIWCFLPVSLFKMYTVVRYGAQFLCNYFWIGGMMGHVCNLLVQIFYYIIPPAAALRSALFVDLADTLCMFLFAVFQCWRWRAVYRARRLLLTDRVRYDAIWASVLQDAESKRNCSEDGGWLLELSAVTDALLLPRDVVPRQRTCSQAKSKLGFVGKGLVILRTISGSSIPVSSVSYPHDHAFNMDHAEPVKSLDQLYSQAVCMHPILVSKVRVWAAASGGCFKAADGSSRFVGVGEHSQPAGVFERVQSASVWPRREQLEQDAVDFAKVKSVARSVEKLVRSYRRVSQRGPERGEMGVRVTQRQKGRERGRERRGRGGET